MPLLLRPACQRLKSQTMADRASSSMVEQFPLKESVGGSSPPWLTKFCFICKFPN